MTNAYSDNLNNYNGPKGNLADFRHASRMFVENNFALAPKFKFLYHVFFSLDPSVANIIPSLVQKYTTEIGLLVKSAELPKFAASIETKNKYNRKKHVQTNIRRIMLPTKMYRVILYWLVGCEVCEDGVWVAMDLRESIIDAFSLVCFSSFAKVVFISISILYQSNAPECQSHHKFNRIEFHLNLKMAKLD